jgi:hypothetical protein
MKIQYLFIYLIVLILFCFPIKAQQKLLPDENDNPVWFKEGKVGIGTSSPLSTLSIIGNMDVFGGSALFYTNGLKSLRIVYDEEYPEHGNINTRSRLEIGIAEGNNHFWSGTKKGDVTLRIGGTMTSGGHRLNLGTMYTRNTEPRSYVALGGYYGHNGVVVHNNGSITIGTNQKGNTDEFLVNAESRFLGNIFLDAGKAIYSSHNDDYLLKDHANGNVTLSAAGGHLYLGYRNTNRLRLYTNLYDASGNNLIINRGGYINQTKTGVTNHFSGNIFLREATSGSGKLHFRGHSNDLASIYSEVHNGTTGTRLVFEVKDDTNDYIRFRHGYWKEGATDLMDLKMNQTIIYKPLGVGSAPNDGFMLTVDGSILTKEIKVSTSGSDWADFVFDDDYNLRTLSEVENFILEHKHLPDIPSVEEIKNSGIDLAQMNKLLLQKIEELTLYVIEKEKEVKDLKNGRYEIKQRLEKLELMMEAKISKTSN